MRSLNEEAIKKHGLILILNEVHDKLDALVFRAHGWPDGLSDEEILSRLGQTVSADTGGFFRRSSSMVKPFNRNLLKCAVAH